MNFLHYTCGAPTSYKWSYNPGKWPYKWMTGVILGDKWSYDPTQYLVGAHLVLKRDLEKTLLEDLPDPV